MKKMDYINNYHNCCFCVFLFIFYLSFALFKVVMWCDHKQGKSCPFGFPCGCFRFFPVWYLYLAKDDEFDLTLSSYLKYSSFFIFYREDFFYIYIYRFVYFKTEYVWRIFNIGFKTIYVSPLSRCVYVLMLDISQNNKSRIKMEYARRLIYAILCFLFTKCKCSCLLVLSSVDKVNVHVWVRYRRNKYFVLAEQQWNKNG